MSNIQKLFSEKIEIFSPVDFTKVSVLTGIIKISLKVRCTHFWSLKMEIFHLIIGTTAIQQITFDFL